MTVEEGSVGGGTGMICHEFKGGIGTASRRVDDHVVGVLVQANYGRRDRFRVDGVPVGELIGDRIPTPSRGERVGLDHRRRRDRRAVAAASVRPARAAHRPRRRAHGRHRRTHERRPLLRVRDRQPRLGRRTAARSPLRMLSDGEISPFYDAVIEATEEAILNAMLAAETMTGRDGNTVHALDADLLAEACSGDPEPAPLERPVAQMRRSRSREMRRQEPSRRSRSWALRGWPAAAVKPLSLCDYRSGGTRPRVTPSLIFSPAGAVGVPRQGDQAVSAIARRPRAARPRCAA